MGIHTGRYAVAVAMLNEALGGSNTTLQNIASRSFSWASYCTQKNGVNLVGPGELDVWFRIHLGGGLLQMMQAMMLAPMGKPTADHLLFSFPVGLGAAVPTAVRYSPGRVSWTSSSTPSTDRLHASFTPVTITAGGKALPKRTGGAHGLGGSDSSEAAVGDEAAGWWTYDPATGIVVVQHQTEPSIEVTA
jgi:hypothetical protein